MKKTIRYLLLLLLPWLAGCHRYNVKMLPPEDINIKFQGSPFAAHMSLYLAPDLKSHVWYGRATNIESKGNRFEIPIGPTLAAASQKTFESLFTRINMADQPEILPGTVGLIVPSLYRYYFGHYDRVFSSGTLRAFVEMRFKIVDGQGKTVFDEYILGSGEKKMEAYTGRGEQWNEALPGITQAAVEDTFQQLINRLAESQSFIEYVANPPPVKKIEDIAVAPSPPPPPPPEPEKQKICKLYINADPQDAKIRIRNIKPLYTPGIQLGSGRYKVEVSKTGYKTRTEWVHIGEEEELRVDMALTKLEEPPPVKKEELLTAKKEEVVPVQKEPVATPKKEEAPLAKREKSSVIKSAEAAPLKREEPTPAKQATAAAPPPKEEADVFDKIKETFGASSTADKEEPPAGPMTSRQYWAVIIGISAYADSRIPSLRYATSDAKGLYDWLVSTSGGKYPPKNVTLLLDKKATNSNIKTALFSWLRQALEEDVVIIYFAGHGSPDSPDTPDNLYLLPYDTQYDNIASTGFPMWDIETALKRFIRAKSVVVIADACHSGGVGQGFDVARRAVRAVDVNPISSRLEQLAQISGGVAVISASGDRQTSQEGKQWGGGHGVFTHFLLEGVRGEADYNKDQRVTLGELIPFLSEQVRRATKSAQSPTVAGKFDPALSMGR